MTARALLTPDLPPRYATPDLPGACVPTVSTVSTVPMPTASFAGRGRVARPGGGTGGEHREEGGGGDSVTP
ncbi:hypothetical protein ACIQMO_33350 [Streptomyces sp. NPDC091406]|uniref:hypothetical protein n=1 Tax=unclassified Streptomyces TaxID=2593676 RepID=UPI003824728F